MSHQQDHIENRILQRDTIVTESYDEDQSFAVPVLLNWSLGIVRLCTLVYTLFVCVSHIYVLDKSIHNMDSSQVYNVIFEILACDFVIHDALAAGGWMPGVSNSFFLIKFAKLIPYYSHKPGYRYFTSIPKNYLRCALLLFVASINNSNNTFTLLHDIRVINIALIVFGLSFLLMGYLSAIKGKLRPFYTDWILESAKNTDTRESLAYETNTWFGWISIVFNVLFLLYLLAVYIYILATVSDAMSLFVIVSCVSKCLLCLLIAIYLILHRHAILEVNWCSIVISLFALNASINVQYDFKIDTPINEYCVYIWFVSLFIEFIRIICVIVMYFRSMYRYYTPFQFVYLEIAEWHHFWLIRQGISNIGLILIMLAMPFLWVALKSHWFVIDMAHTPFFDYESPLSIKEINIDGYLKIFEDIWDEVDSLLDYLKFTDIPDVVMCGIILAAFAAILSAGLAPGGGTAAGIKYQVERVYKIAKRIYDMFEKIYDAIKELVAKINAVIKKVQDMITRTQQFVSLLDQISPKHIGLTSAAGLFGLVIIPCTTIIIILWVSFLDRSLRFNKFQISAHTRPWWWILFTGYLLLLNIANLLVVVSLHALLTEIFVFETIVFSSEVVYLDGYHAFFIVHILIIVGLSLFILDRLLMHYCAKSSLYQWSKMPNDMVLHSFCKCKPTTPSVQSMIGYLIEYYQWHDADIMTYAAMRACVTGMDGLRIENEKVVQIMCATCWRCIKYKRFKDGHENQITRKDWEYFLTSYKVGTFSWTQPATDRNTELLLTLKPFIDANYLDEDCIAYYTFCEQDADKEKETMNVEGCRRLLVHLRSLCNGHLTIDMTKISENDLGVKLLLNLSKKQLEELLARFDPEAWRLITAVNVIHSNEDDQPMNVLPQSAQPQRDPEGNKIASTAHNTANVSEIEMNALGHQHIETKEEEEGEEESSELPTDWERLVDDNDVPYYHNAVTGETEWVKPKAALADGDILTIPPKPEEPIADARSDLEDDASLPEYWKMVTNNGVPYYYNDETEKTQWERPMSKKDSIAKATPTGIMPMEEKKEAEQGRAGAVVPIAKKKKSKEAATQTSMSLNGIFERKIVYHLYFKIAMNDILMESTRSVNDRSNTVDTLAMDQKKEDERETLLIDAIDTQWMAMNETLLLQLNRDNECEDFAPNKFAPNTVLQALGGTRFTRDIEHEAGKSGATDSKRWFKYLYDALIEYNNNYTQNGLILVFPKQENYETWCIYTLLTALISALAIYSVVSYEFMSMTYQPTLELDNTVAALVKSKESMITEWESVNFESYFEFYEVSDDQFYDCDIGSILQLIPNPLKKYNSFSTFLSSMMEGFTVEDIALIELLDEFDNFELNGELFQVEGLSVALQDMALSELTAYVEAEGLNIDLEALELGALQEYIQLNVDELSIDLDANWQDMALAELKEYIQIEGLDIDLDALNIASSFKFVQFPMIELCTWPAITISFYAEWYFILLFGPVFSFILVCAVCIFGWKQFEISKQLIGLFVIFGGFCGLQFVLSLGSILSVVTTYLPHSVVFITYEYGYYNMILCNVLVILIGLLIFVDVIAGEHVPLLSRILEKNTNRANRQESFYHLAQYSS